MKTIYKSAFGLLFLFSILLVQCKKSSDTPVTPKSSAKSLTNPAIDGVTSATSAYDASTSTYTMTVPFGTVITALKLTFNLSTAATANPASGSTQNFTNPVTYIVTAEDGSTQNYVVKVVVTAPPKSSEKQITEFKFASLSPVISATIDQTARKIGATLSASTSLSALAPTITLSSKATVSPASGIAQNFTKPVTYTVTAEDGSTQTYEVTITSISPTALIDGKWKYDSNIGAGSCNDLVSTIWQISNGVAAATFVPTNGYGWKAGDNFLSNIAQTTSPNNYSAIGFSRSAGGAVQDPNIKVLIAIATGTQSMTVTYTNVCNPVQVWVKTN